MKALKSKSASIPNSRWLAYATAGAASAFVSANSLEAHIHYSGKINSDFTQEGFGTIRRSFALSEGKAFWLELFVESNGPYFNYALFFMPSGRFRGLLNANYWWNAGFIEKLHAGQVVSHGPFRPG